VLVPWSIDHSPTPTESASDGLDKGYGSQHECQYIEIIICIYRDNHDVLPGQVPEQRRNSSMMQGHEIELERCAAESEPTELRPIELAETSRPSTGTGKDSEPRQLQSEKFAETSRPSTATSKDAESKQTELHPKALAGTSKPSTAINKVAETTPPPSINESKPGVLSSCEDFCFVHQKHRYKHVGHGRLMNDLLVGVGFLEFGSGLDFPANVFNTLPVPHFAVIMMACTGSVALFISTYALRDALLSWPNVQLLRAEKYFLLEQRSRCDEDKRTRIDLDWKLDLNFRETGIEIMGRVGMDAIMGFGTFIVGIGTLLAIGGSNPRIFECSNLLSGYIGNAPVALYGLFNAAWSIYLFRIAYQHGRVGGRVTNSIEIRNLLLHRSRILRVHATMTGVAGFLAGIGSLITATRWWGYTILAPCVVSSIFTNYLWRKRLGYSRPSIRYMPIYDRRILINELERVIAVEPLFSGPAETTITELVNNPSSLQEVIDFLLEFDLFTSFCQLLLKDDILMSTFFGSAPEGNCIIEPRRLIGTHEKYRAKLLDLAHFTVRQQGRQALRDRKRFLLDAFGCWGCVSECKDNDDMVGSG